MDIKVTPLGAGQDVGRSCILISFGGKNIMLDCGMHMGYNDDRRFPDFSYLAKEGPVTSYLDCVIISHFHLDHCGALPYLTEVVGYDGPVFMTAPTKSICPILLEDYRKITIDKLDKQAALNFFKAEDIKACMKKVKTVNLHESYQVDEELSIKAYYAGHVLGAAMFEVRVGNQSVVYTGDYNMTPDRHLGAAWIDKCRPDVLITESTYATTIRDSKRCRERDFIKKVHGCLDKGGKVLIPVFALGRAQELCILLETYWERMQLQYPIYFSLGLTEKANNYYQLFITWTSQKIKKTFVERNMFDFKHIKPFDRSFIDKPGPMVVFATPGMLHAGLSLQVFKKWAPFEQNMIIIPGYCVAGTVGHKVLAGQKKIELENKQMLDVKLSVEYMSFSAHADAKGIMQLITNCEPKNVVLVHGENGKMVFLKNQIEKEFNIDCFKPANGETITIKTQLTVPASISVELLKNEKSNFNFESISNESGQMKKKKLMHGVLMMEQNCIKVVHPKEAIEQIGLVQQQIQFSTTIKIKHLPDTMTSVCTLFEKEIDDINTFKINEHTLTVENVKIEFKTMDTSPSLVFSWNLEDEELGSYLFSIIKENMCA